jgi:hypothetical protein
VGHLLGIVVPLALGAAITPTIVGVQVLTLSALRRRGKDEAPPPAKRPDEPRLGRSFALGAGLMATNFSSLILYFPAMHEIGSSDAGATAQIVCFVFAALLTAFALNALL